MTKRTPSSIPFRLRSVPRFLVWQASRQPGTLAAGVTFGVLWMLCQAIWPWLLGRAIDEGVGGRSSAVLLWCLVLIGVAVVQVLAGMLRHRMAVSNWLSAALGVGRLIGHHSAETGPAITATNPAGEVIATVSTDTLSLGAMFDVVARLVGGVIAYITVSCILILTSVQLGLVVLFGVPVLALLLGLVIRPLQRRHREWRRETGMLTTLGADTVAGLRILRGIGGEDEFLARYTARSQSVRRAGVRIAHVQSWLDGLQVLLPGLFLAFIVWFGARLVLSGQITPGELVAFYGYATFLVIPLRTAVEAAQTFASGLVAARRVLDVLRVQPAARDVENVGEAPPHGADLVDVASGVVVHPGLLTGLVDANPDAAAVIATRLGRFHDEEHREAPVLWGGIDHTTVPIAELRKRIVVSHAQPHLFGGSLLDGLYTDPRRFEHTETGQIRKVNLALSHAAAAETVEALPDGLDQIVAERGRSFSGGQRQRLTLARALLTEAEVLVLVEPTSAVDAHTEARIAASLRDARADKTTVVVSASPLMLDRMDVVQVLRDGSVVGTGTHASLLRLEDEVGDLYRSIVARTVNAAEPAEGAALEEASTGSIDTLWHEAEHTGAIAIHPPVDDS